MVEQPLPSVFIVEDLNNSTLLKHFWNLEDLKKWWNLDEVQRYYGKYPQDLYVHYYLGDTKYSAYIKVFVDDQEDYS